MCLNRKIGKSYQRVSTWLLTSAFGMFLAAWNFLERIDNEKSIMFNKFFYDITLLLGIVFFIWSFVLIIIGHLFIRNERRPDLILTFILLFILFIFVLIILIRFEIFKYI